MVNNTRQIMMSNLENIIIPYLREHGFKGSFPHFRRKQTTHIDFITFQFNRYGGSFVVELAICLVEGLLDCFGEEIPFTKLTAHDISERYRLTSKDEVTNGLTMKCV